MTFEHRVLAVLAGLAAVWWVLALVRSRRLYVGFAAVFLLVIGTAIAAIAVPRLPGLAVALFGWAGVLTLAAIAGMVFLIYLGSQVTLVADRVNVIAQEIAIERAERTRSSDVDHPATDRANRHRS